MSQEESQHEPQIDSPGPAPRRRFQAAAERGSAKPAPASNAAPSPTGPELREEVVVRGSGGTAGGPPGSAAGDNMAAQQSIALDPAITFDPAEFDRQGDTGITPCQKPTTGGEDWLSVNFWVAFDNFEELKTKLDTAQVAARSRSTPNPRFGSPTDGDVIEAGERRLIVQPRGGRLGVGERALAMSWKLRSGQGIDLALANIEDAKGSTPNVNAQASSTTMMWLGFDAVWEEMQSLVECLGGKVHRHNVSRVDAAADLAEVAIDEFYKPFAAGHLVTRAKFREAYKEARFVSEHFAGTQPTGFAIGKSPLRLVVYDKLLEISRNADKRALLQANRWGGLPEVATRVELQLRRAKLKQFGVDTVDDWWHKRSAIIDKLTSEWLRFTDGPVDRKHASRAPTLPIWERTREAFRDWTGLSVGADLSPLPLGRSDTSKQVAQLVGLGLGILVRSNKDIYNNAIFFREIEALVRDGVGRRDMAVEFNRKLLELGRESFESVSF